MLKFLRIKSAQTCKLKITYCSTKAQGAQIKDKILAFPPIKPQMFRRLNSERNDAFSSNAQNPGELLVVISNKSDIYNIPVFYAGPDPAG